MKVPVKVAVVAAAVSAIGFAANAQPSTQCIELSPDPSGGAAEEPFAGPSAYLYVELPNDPITGLPTTGSNLQRSFSLHTSGGRLLIRVVEIPAGHGWFGPF